MPKMLEAREGFLFGADPELFVKDKKGRFVSAAGLIPGTKENPHVVEDGAVQVDGMAAEFNINPCSTFEQFNCRVNSVMGQLTAMLPKGYSLAAIPSVRFDPEIFDAAPDDAKELGCSPDFNAWTGDVNPPPFMAEDPYLRTASGHIHVGWTEDAALDDPQHVLNCRDLVKQFDWYLGTWSIARDPDTTRRNLYGKAGAMRYKPYGVEYRVLSNFWLNNKDDRAIIWNRMQVAINDMRTRHLPTRAPSGYSELVQDSINNSALKSKLLNAFKYPIETMDTSFSNY